MTTNKVKKSTASKAQKATGKGRTKEEKAMTTKASSNGSHTYVAVITLKGKAVEEPYTFQSHDAAHVHAVVRTWMKEYDYANGTQITIKENGKPFKVFTADSKAARGYTIESLVESH